MTRTHANRHRFPVPAGEFSSADSMRDMADRLTGYSSHGAYLATPMIRDMLVMWRRHPSRYHRTDAAIAADQILADYSRTIIGRHARLHRGILTIPRLRRDLIHYLQMEMERDAAIEDEDDEDDTPADDPDDGVGDEI